jgi:hypothetical protein
MRENDSGAAAATGGYAHRIHEHRAYESSEGQISGDGGRRG